MPEASAVIKIMIFAAVMNGSSNAIAQAITAYKTNVCSFLIFPFHLHPHEKAPILCVIALSEKLDIHAKTRCRVNDDRNMSI